MNDAGSSASGERDEDDQAQMPVVPTHAEEEDARPERVPLDPRPEPSVRARLAAVGRRIHWL
jgi:hypothetical protein